MSGRKVSVDGLADAVMEELDDYRELATDTMKAAVDRAGKTVRSEIRSGAPVRTGKYARSWTTKRTRESSTALEVTVYSPTRYMLAHLLEHGHAKRNGGRVRGNPHIAPAQAVGEEQLEHEIMRGLKDG